MGSVANNRKRRNKNKKKQKNNGKRVPSASAAGGFSSKMIDPLLTEVFDQKADVTIESDGSLSVKRKGSTGSYRIASDTTHPHHYDNRVVVPDGVQPTVGSTVLSIQRGTTQLKCLQMCWSGLIFRRNDDVMKFMLRSFYRGEADNCIPVLEDVDGLLQAAIVKSHNFYDIGFTGMDVKERDRPADLLRLKVGAELYVPYTQTQCVRMSFEKFTENRNGLLTAWAPGAPTCFLFRTGPAPGGSRDGTVVAPSRQWVPLCSSDVIGKYNLDMPENWTDHEINVGGNMGEMAIRSRNDAKLVTDHGSETVIGDYVRHSRQFPDTYDLRYVRHLQDVSVTWSKEANPDGTPAIAFGGSKTKMLEKAVRLQTSFWTLFQAEFYFVLNHMAASALDLYAREFGYTHVVNLEGVTTLRDNDVSLDYDSTGPADLLSLHVRRMSTVMVELITKVSAKLRSLTRPGEMVHFFYPSTVAIRECIQEATHFFQNECKFFDILSVRIDQIERARIKAQMKLSIHERKSRRGLKVAEGTCESRNDLDNVKEVVNNLKKGYKAWDYVKNLVMMLECHHMKAMQSTAYVASLMQHNEMHFGNVCVPFFSPPTYEETRSIEKKFPVSCTREIKRMQAEKYIRMGSVGRQALALVYPSFEYHAFYTKLSNTRGSGFGMFLPPLHCARRAAFEYSSGLSGRVPMDVHFDRSCFTGIERGATYTTNTNGKLGNKDELQLTEFAKTVLNRWHIAFGTLSSTCIDKLINRESDEIDTIGVIGQVIKSYCVPVDDTEHIAISTFEQEHGMGRSWDRETFGHIVAGTVNYEDILFLIRRMVMVNGLSWMLRTDFLEGSYPFKAAMLREDMMRRKKREDAKRLKKDEINAAVKLQSVARMVIHKQRYDRIVFAVLDIQVFLRKRTTRRARYLAFMCSLNRLRTVSKSLEWFFSWENLARDVFLVNNLDPLTATVPVQTLAKFQSIMGLLVGRPFPEATVAAAARGVSYLRVTPEGGIGRIEWIDNPEEKVDELKYNIRSAPVYGYVPPPPTHAQPQPPHQPLTYPVASPGYFTSYVHHPYHQQQQYPTVPMAIPVYPSAPIVGHPYGFTEAASAYY